MPSVLITGASSGIGAALAEGYASPNMTLVLLGRDEKRLREVAMRCEAKGACVKTASVDVRDQASMAEVLLRMDDETPIDLLIANAGISTGTFSGEESFVAAETVFDINVTGVLNTIHPLIPRMVARRHGQLAIMSSLAGLLALPGAAAYSASKNAVRAYGDALRGKLKPQGVCVSVICPGWITTPLTDKNDFPMPFLMSVERASAIIIRGLSKKKSRIAFPMQLYVALRIMMILPVSWSDVLLAQLPNKRQKT